MTGSCSRLEDKHSCNEEMVKCYIYFTSRHGAPEETIALTGRVMAFTSKNGSLSVGAEEIEIQLHQSSNICSAVWPFLLLSRGFQLYNIQVHLCYCIMTTDE